MKLRTRLTLSIFIVVLITMAVIAYGMQRAYSETFFDYIEGEEEARLQRIVTDIGNITRNESIDLTSGRLNAQLQIYARDANINITIMDMESNIIANYQGLLAQEAADIQVDQYQLVDRLSRPIGSMLVTYDSSSPALTASLRNFQARSLGSTMIGIIGFGVVAMVFSAFFSRKITDPIEALRDATTRIRQQDFNVSFENSDIHEIQELSANVQFLAATLRQQDEARKNYAQDISHELRTPLTNIQLHLEAMQDGILPMDQESLGVIEANAKQLSQLVEKLKNTFREASLLSAEEIRSVNVSDVTNRILDAFEPRMTQKEAKFVRAVDADIQLQTDERLFSQVLSNLLSNAIKAIELGGWIRVSLTSDKKHVTLSVIDNGVGIPAKDLPHLFDRFYRVDSSRNRSLGGQGLGLSITYNIVQQLGGKIDVSSRVGKGTTFRMILPYAFFSASE